MAEKEEVEGGKKKGGGWIRAALGTVGGLLSGAVVMYLTAWFNQAIKPAKPVPNFRVEHEGCTVHFQNLSPGYSGWWDFGDGSELVPAAGGADPVVHKYEHPGDYTVKLSLSNLLGEENDRTVSLHLEEAQAAKQPQVASLTAERVSPGTSAPAMYKISAKTQNAPLCIWDWGDARPLEVVTEGTGSQERLVTFDKARNYNIKLLAVNDTLSSDKTVLVSLKDAPADGVSVVLTASDAGTGVRTRTVPFTLSDTFRPDMKGDVCPLSGRDLLASSPADRYKDWVIRDVQLTGANGKQVSLGDKAELPLDAAGMGFQSARSLRMQVGQDRRSVRLVGELIRSPGKTAVAQPSVLVQGVLVEERRNAETRAVPVPAMLVMPAAGKTTTETVALPPLPADWIDAQPRKLRLAVQDGPSTATQDVQVPCRVELTLQKRRCILAATPFKDKDNKDQVRLELTDASGRFSAN